MIPKKHWATEKGEYMPSNLDYIRNYFQQNLEGKTFLDLGSGYGEVVELAQQCGATAIGIEWEQDMVNHSVVETQQGDFLDANFNDYDFLYYFVFGTDDEDSLKQKLSTYNGKLIVYVNDCCEGFYDSFFNGLSCDYYKIVAD